MDPENQIYLGVWTNWSRGSAVMGATLTMTQSSGNILIAFTAIFIPFVASRFWKMLCFAFHTCTSKKGAQDAIYHQRQVVLRNSSSPDSGLISLLYLVWAWRGSQAKAIVRLLPLLVFATLFIVGFTVAGGYSSQITSAMGNEVLINGDDCGLLDWSQDNTNISSTIAINSHEANEMNDAANYVQQCYSNQGTSLFDCNRFVVQSLPTTSNNNFGCPFASDICRDNVTNIRLDTGYLDSNDHMGLNAPPEQRFVWRQVLSCAPLKTEGYKTSFTRLNKTFIRYHYGSHAATAPNTTSPSYTDSVPDLPAQYTQTENTNAGLNFRLMATHRQGTISTSHAIEANEVYIPTDAASPLGCKQQYQWCNPEYTIPGGCGPLAGWMDATAGAYPFFNMTVDDFDSDIPDTERGNRLVWAARINSVSKSGIFNMLLTFGAKALESQKQLASGVQLGMAENQWHLDVTNLWNMTLALHQAAFVDTALGYSHEDVKLQSFVSKPANDQERHLCRSQKIRRSGYASFSLFGLLFTYILGSLIILMSFAVDPIMRCLHKRRKYRQYQYLEWRTNGSLQLHRLAQDELGYGNWSGCTNMVPVTRPEDRLADLDINDLKYPRLNRESIMEEIKPEGNNTETVGSDNLSTEASENTVLNVDVENPSSDPDLTSEAEGRPQSHIGANEQQEAQGDFILFGDDVQGAQMYLQVEDAENDPTANVPLPPSDHGIGTNNEAHGSDIPSPAASATLPQVSLDTTSPRI
ncbi:hypothetical protein PG984_007065 [Apiospora sp. TS-2023a]